jgi:hypothetical protein
MKSVIRRFSLGILVCSALLSVAGCSARTSETQPVATIEKPADSGPPLVTEPASLETFDAFLNRA